MASDKNTQNVAVTTGTPPQTAAKDVTTGTPPQTAAKDVTTGAPQTISAGVNNSFVLLPNEGGGSKPSSEDEGTGDGGTGDGGTGGGNPFDRRGALTPAEPIDPNNPGGNTGSNSSSTAETIKRLIQGIDTSEQIKEANEAWSKATGQYGEQAQNILGQYQQNTESGLDQYGQNTQDIINKLSSLTDKELADYAASTGQTIDAAMAQINGILKGLQDNLGPAEAGRVGRVGTEEKEDLLRQIVESQKEQSRKSIDYAVEQGVNELQRAEEDAQGQFQTQRDQIAAQERQALDNQALSAEMRGDRGGIGQAQYGAIQNNAATNQLTVNKQQTKLATDTARQIADLRAQGEFQKADQLLSITQSYLGQLMQLKQWADEMNVSVDEFNIGVEQWEQEYNAKIQQLLGEMGINAAQYEAGQRLSQQQYLTGQRIGAAQDEANLNLSREQSIQQQRQSLNDALAQYGMSNAKYMSDSDIQRISNILSAYQQNAANMTNTEMEAANLFGESGDGTQTAAMREAEAKRKASAAEQMISSGITPTLDQLEALGWTKDQYNAYKKATEEAKKAAGRGSSNTLYKLTQTMTKDGVPLDDIKQWLTNMTSMPGEFSQADIDKTWEALGKLTVDENYYENPNYKDYGNVGG